MISTVRERMIYYFAVGFAKFKRALIFGPESNLIAVHRLGQVNFMHLINCLRNYLRGQNKNTLAIRTTHVTFVLRFTQGRHSEGGG